MRASPSSPLRHFGQGLVIGVGELIPALGAGTLAVVLGVYERAIDSIRAASALRFREVEWSLIIPAGLGAGIALAIGAGIVPPLVERFPVASAALLFGLVAGALLVPWRQMRTHSARHWVLAVVGAATGLGLAGLPGQALDSPSVLYLLAAGAVVSAAIVLPGISASYILLALGVYQSTYAAVDARDLGYLAALGGGVVLGLMVLARAVGWLLDHRYDATLATLTGLMAGSLRLLWPWAEDDGRLAHPPPSLRAAAFALALAVAGFLLVRVITRLEEAEPHTPPPA